MRKREPFNKHIRAHVNLKNEIEEIRKIRLLAGKDKTPTTSSRITLAMTRHRLFPSIKRDILRADLRNRKGAVTDIFIWMILGFALLVFAGVFLYFSGTVTSVLTSIDTGNPSVNISKASATTFGNINTGLQQLRFFTYALFFGLAFAIFVSAFLVRTHPVFFMFHLIIVIASIIFSIIISNSYETLLNSTGILGDSLATFKGASNVMLNLPIWVTVIGFISSILLFINMSRDSEQAGGNF